MRLLWRLTLASLKMYLREREAILWSFAFPLLAILIFGFIRLEGGNAVAVGVAPAAGSSDALLHAMQAIEAFDIRTGTREQLLRLLEKGEMDLVVLPGGTSGDSIAVVRSTAKPRQAEIGILLLRQVLDARALAAAPEVPRTGLRIEEVSGRRLRYADFLLPGILGMSIMQLGIFGVAFTFVSLKRRGILRRLSVTPIRPRDFILAQVITRLLVLMLQIVLMVAVGILVLHLQIVGNLVSLLVLGILGSIVFLSIGFALAGVASTENQVAPLANMISLPMLLLSGVFFDRGNLPGVLRAFTDFIPLSNLVDGLRAVTLEGSSLFDVWPSVVGLLAWGVICVWIAVKTFRWE